MPKFRKKPVEVIANQWFENENNWTPGVLYEPKTQTYYVVTIHNQRCYIVDGDWILPEPKSGFYYPVKPDIFEATHDPITVAEQQ